ncbi:MAG TPA: deoxyribonuclease V [Anaerolineae bacterium]|nr:deoxyribonuclease V [Anaerolineae bacterium]HOQ98849.1 deoxyribonuclease V [Anaerolineae bacterium]HPL27073.1 deoxyribonuclease V [Anaerolineae bacterium]
MMITLKHGHPWKVTPAEAVGIQERLRQLVVAHDGLAGVRAVAGLDVGIREGRARAALVVLSYPALERLGEAVAERPVEFPYVPGLLTFREGPVALEALERLATPWDVLLCDGQGYAHPRRLGIASHLGVLLDRPSVGCAKSRLVGSHGEVGDEPGSWAELVDRGEVVGAALRTRRGVKPVFVSVGHRIDLAGAIELVLACTRNRRLPEPARLAHQLASGGAK